MTGGESMLEAYGFCFPLGRYNSQTVQSEFILAELIAWPISYLVCQLAQQAFFPVTKLRELAVRARVVHSV